VIPYPISLYQPPVRVGIAAYKYLPLQNDLNTSSTESFGILKAISAPHKLHRAAAYNQPF